MKITWAGFKKALHKAVLLRPILKILGVKDGSAVAKGAEVVVVVDKVLNEKETK